MDRWGSKSTSRKQRRWEFGVRQQEPLKLHQEAVERVSESTYLQSVISEAGGTDKDITAMIRKAQSAFSTLMPVWKSLSD